MQLQVRPVTPIHRICMVVVFVCLSTIGTAFASTLTPLDIARLQYVADVQISPDGQHIAYVRAVPREPGSEKDGPAYLELHIVDNDGNSRPYITGHQTVSKVRWLGNGNLCFLAKRSGDKHPSLYHIAIDGGEAERILSHDSGIADYSFSADGTTLAFVASAKKKDAQKIKPNATVYEESTPRKLVWIASIKWQGNGRRQTPTAAKAQPIDLGGSASAPQLRADGKALAVAIAPTPQIDDHYMNRSIHLVDLTKKKKKSQRELKLPGKLGAFHWSPDGVHLAIQAGIDRHDPSPGRIWLAKTQEDDLKVLLGEFDGAVSQLSWNGNDEIIYLASHGTASSIHRIQWADGKQSPIANQDGLAIRGMSLSRDGGTAAVTGHSANHPMEVFSLGIADSKWSRLTDSNPWLAKKKLGKQEVVRYKARDGLEIEGILIHPVKRKKRKRVPLIMVIHGGPESHYSNGWMTFYSGPGQMAAGRGFAVFYPNYRGSTGRGVAFSKVSQGDPAGNEFNDIVDGLDHLVEIGLVDAKRVGITGGSYGGYASAWAATRFSSKFRASVVFVGISDQISKIGTTDIPEEMYAVHFLERPWTNWDKYLKASPIYHADGSTTATLVMHGREDRRVDSSQAKSLYRHLKLRGEAPVRLVLYAGEGHGNRKANARFDYSLRLLRWMEHFVKKAKSNLPPLDLNYDKALGVTKSK